jgi:hypothetical protein
LSRHSSVDLFFGVSSSVILLLELVLESLCHHHLNLISCINPPFAKTSDLDEFEDFMLALKWYQNNPKLKTNDISISLI